MARATSPPFSCLLVAAAFLWGREPASGADNTCTQKMPTSEHAGHQNTVPPEADKISSETAETECFLVREGRSLASGSSVSCWLWDPWLTQVLHEEPTHSIQSG